MKKIMFIQNEAHVLGGIFQVNKTLGLEFYKQKYDVQIVSLRNNHKDDYEKTPFKQVVLNSHDRWEFTQRRDVLNAFKNYNKPLNSLKKYLIDYFNLKNDLKKLKDYILKENPDYIIVSHYQVLAGIPKSFLKKVIYVQHSTFNLLYSDKKNFKVIKKYKNNIFGFAWLAKSTKLIAEKTGFKNSYVIYNPVRFNCGKVANVVKNKKLIALTRFSPEKRIELMLEIVNDVFKDKRFNEWSMELYGSGELSKKSRDIITNNKKIRNMGVVNDSMNVLLQSSCILNTSIIEGYPLSIIEAYSCGVPAITFDFGEAAVEEVTNGYNGFVIEQNNVKKYKEKLIYLMSNLNELKKFGMNAKEDSKKYEPSEIAKNWINLFKEMDGQNEKS